MPFPQRMGIDSFAAPELNVPMYATSLSSATASLAFLISVASSHLPAAAVESSLSVYLTVYPPATPFFSSSARLMALTIVSLWALLEPWRGSEDQISISPLLPPPPPPPPLHAAKASAATAASVAILRLSIHSPPGWPGRRSLTGTTVDRGTPPHPDPGDAKTPRPALAWPDDVPSLGASVGPGGGA